MSDLQVVQQENAQLRETITQIKVECYDVVQISTKTIKGLESQLNANAQGIQKLQDILVQVAKVSGVEVNDTILQPNVLADAITKLIAPTEE